MITRSSLTHLAKSADSYAYDNNTLHIRFRSAKGEVDRVTLWIGDPYIWAKGGLDGGNLGGSDAHGWIGGTEVPMYLEAKVNIMTIGLLPLFHRKSVAVTVLSCMVKREKNCCLVKNAVWIFRTSDKQILS